MKMEKVKKVCPCKSTGCPRHSDCEECREYHYSKDSLPACER
jgi:hypothetical protein